jgi:hypothetical protein
MLFKKHHVVKVVLNKGLPFRFVEVAVLVDVVAESHLSYLFIVVLSSQKVISRLLCLPSDMFQVKLRL